MIIICTKGQSIGAEGNNKGILTSAARRNPLIKRRAKIINREIMIKDKIEGEVDNVKISIADGSGRCPKGNKYVVSIPAAEDDGWKE